MKKFVLNEKSGELPKEILTGTDELKKEAIDLQEKIIERVPSIASKIKIINKEGTYLFKYINKYDETILKDQFLILFTLMKSGDAEGKSGDLIYNAFASTNAETVIRACTEFIRGFDILEKNFDKELSKTTN